MGSLDVVYVTDVTVAVAGLTVMPGLWESHNHGYGGLAQYGDRAGRIWLAYGITDLQSQGEPAYDQLENRTPTPTRSSANQLISRRGS